MNFYGAFSLFMSFESIMNFTKKIPRLVSLIASIEFNDSFGVEFYISWIYEWNMRSEESCDSETIFIRPSYCSLCYFEPRYISLGLKPLLLIQFRMYQMYLSSQSSVLVVILHQAIHQWALNPHQQPISEKAKTTLPFVTIKAFSFVISFISLWTILLSFTLCRI